MRHEVKYIVPAVRLNPGAGDQPGRKASRFCFPGEGLSFFLQVHHFVTFADHFRQRRVLVCVIVIHCIYGVFASAIKREISSHRLFSVLNNVGGVIFMLFSAGLLISSLLPFWQ